MEETIRVLVCVGFALLLIMLRLDAARFGVAEYVDEGIGTAFQVVRRRVAWYVLGVAFVGAVLIAHPDADRRLGLHPGDGLQALVLGLGYAALGLGQALGVAFLRDRPARPLDAGEYGWGLLDAGAVAVVDETAFRGVMLGILLDAGLDPLPAVLLQAIVYALATRTGGRDRDPYGLGVALGIGLLGGWLTIVSGGLGAAVVGHLVTRFAVFMFAAPEAIEGGGDAPQDADDGGPAFERPGLDLRRLQAGRRSDGSGG